MGQPTVNDIVKLLTMCDESKPALSTYYIKFQHRKTLSDAMMDRIGELELKTALPLTYFSIKTLKEESRTLKEDCGKYYDFLTWEYVKHHLKQ